MKKSDCEAEQKTIAKKKNSRSENNFLNRLTFLNKHRILSRGLKKAFYGNFVKFLTAGHLVYLRPCPAAGHSTAIFYGEPIFRLFVFLSAYISEQVSLRTSERACSQATNRSNSYTPSAVI